MTNETAFNTIVTILSLNLVSVELNSDVRQALTVAASALEKQISKKPFKDNGDFICPSCNTYYNMCKGYDHCTQCGQQLDWGK